ncbi:MAG: PP2C family protein-serine/threonine phosphatase, partial [Planctomycetota bacterium]|nr:PP2C family protein-serine/threonine phosphatase [Planctomycetota bacterium]
YLIGPNRAVSRLTVNPALPLGVEDDFEYREEIVRFDEKPVGLFLFTDGVPDAENDSEERYEEQRLFDLLQENDDLEPGELIARVRASIRQFTRNHVQTDDITLLVIRLE